MEKGRKRWKELGGGGVMSKFTIKGIVVPGGEGMGERGQGKNCVMKILKLVQFVLWL